MKKINRREFIEAVAASTALAAWPSSVPAAPPERPNVLFILADDLGYGDLSCYGRPDYPTPVLDSLARQGIRFTSAYAAASVCTPTRCAFITGRYPHRLPIGLEEPLGAENDKVGLPPDHPTVASLLKANGYETALVGKWHLGILPEYGPLQHGFDEFFGILTGAADYFTHKGTHGKLDLYEGLSPAERIGYMTDLLTERAVQYISRRRTRPFYLSLQYTAPHWPWEGPEDIAVSRSIQKFSVGSFQEGGSLKAFGNMMKSMDAGIGGVLKTLRDAKLDRKTLVIFTSDNGGERYSYNWPFSMQKGNLWEGGLRVPAIVRWPGVVPAGRTTDQAAITMDWTATILAVAQTKADPAYPLDGEDLLPVCTGARGAYDRTLFWRNLIHDAARQGQWKYLKESGREYLFDLSVDLGEKNDLREKHPETFQQLRAGYEKWQSQMLPRPRAS